MCRTWIVGVLVAGFVSATGCNAVRRKSEGDANQAGAATSSSAAAITFMRFDVCKQCNGCTPIDDALAPIKSMGIQVLEIVQCTLHGVFCAACGYPTGEGYGVLVRPEDAARLEDLGWEQQDGAENTKCTRLESVR
jgi:hypothetical protein